MFSNLLQKYRNHREEKRVRKLNHSFRKWLREGGAIVRSFIENVHRLYGKPTYYAPKIGWTTNDLARMYANDATDAEITVLRTIFDTLYKDWYSITGQQRDKIITSVIRMSDIIFKRKYGDVSKNVDNFSEWVSLTVNSFDVKPIAQAPRFSPESEKIHKIAADIYEKFNGYKLTFYRVNHLLLEIDKLPERQQKKARKEIYDKVKAHQEKYRNIRNDDDISSEVISEAVNAL